MDIFSFSMFYPTKVWRKAAEIIRLILHATPHSVIPASRTRLRPSIPCLERNWQCPSLSILHGARHFGDIYPHDQTFEWPYDDVYTHSNIMHIYIYYYTYISIFFITLCYIGFDVTIFLSHHITLYIYTYITYMYVCSLLLSWCISTDAEQQILCHPGHSSHQIKPSGTTWVQCWSLAPQRLGSCRRVEKD